MIKKLIWPFKNPCVNLIFWTLACVCCFLCFHNANFIFGDDYGLLNVFQSRELPSIHAFMSLGRFVPLFNLDSWWVLHLPMCQLEWIPYIAYVLSAFRLLVVLVCCLIIVRDTSWKDSRMGECGWLVLLFVFAPLVCNSYLRVFCEDIFPESRVIFLHALFLISFLFARRWNNGLLYVLSFIWAVLATGYKETAFVPSSAFATVLLVFGWKKATGKCKAFAWAILGYAILYCLIYVAYVRPQVVVSYREGKMSPFFDCLVYYYRNPVLLLAASVLVVRLLCLMVCRNARHVFWDALLIAGHTLVLSYVVLGMTQGWYAAPAYLFLVPVFAHWFFTLFGRFHYYPSFALLILFVASLWISAKDAWTYWCDNQWRRVSDVSILATLLAKYNARAYGLYSPQNDMFSYWYRCVLESFSRAIDPGWKGLEDRQEVPQTLAPGEVFVVPNLYWSQMAGVNLTTHCTHCYETGLYRFFIGPTKRKYPKIVNRKVRFVDFDCLQGFYTDPKNPCWGGKDCYIRFCLQEEWIGRPLRLRLRMLPCLVPQNLKMTVSLEFNGHQLPPLELTRMVMEDHIIELPAELTAEDKADIKMSVDHTICPQKLGVGPDPRDLGILFEELEILPDGGSAAR